jgi:hypothetical protein
LEGLGIKDLPLLGSSKTPQLCTKVCTKSLQGHYDPKACTSRSLAARKRITVFHSTT